MFGIVESNGGRDTSEEDGQDERPDRGAGINSDGDLVIGSRTALEEYGGNDDEGTDDSTEGGSINRWPLDQVLLIIVSDSSFTQ